MQLIYGGQTNYSFPKFRLPNDFSLSVNPKLYNNGTESIKLINEILVAYIQQKQAKLNAPN